MNSKKSQPQKTAADEHQAIVDAVAIQLFCKGFPERNVYQQAERFWSLRSAHIAQKTEQNSASFPGGGAGGLEAGK